MHRILSKRLIVVCAAAVLVAGAGTFAPREAGAAWSHGVSGGYDVWYLNGSQKFRYRLSNHQWWHYSTRGGWGTLSATGVASTFIGNGGWYPTGNGFTYRYLQSTNSGYFRDAGVYRFLYKYATARWYHSGNTISWQVLGNAGISSAFVGMGAHAVGNGWTFQYCLTCDMGYFKDGAYNRFRYQYRPGRWDHTANTLSWQTLSADRRTAAFVGSGIGWYVLGNGFTYQYCANCDVGSFKDGGYYRFRYWYGPGQWQHTANTLAWYALGTKGLTASFVGDTKYHKLGDGFWYQYFPTADNGYWSLYGTSFGDRFRYTYDTGQWNHRRSNSGFYVLGKPGRTASFVGDRKYHSLGDGFWYLYSLDTDWGYWSRDGTHSGDRFGYSYGAGRWNHRGYGGVQFWAIGAYQLSPDFIGDEKYHNLGEGFWYQYFFSLDSARWSRDGTSNGDRFRYRYGTGQWAHIGYGGGFYELGTGLSARFIGNNNDWYSVGNGWWFFYDYSRDASAWSRNGTDAGARFEYEYVTGRWFHRWQDEPIVAGYIKTYALGPSHMSGEFIGAGQHTFNDGYSYQYDYDFDLGYWFGSTNRYLYDYSFGKWWYKLNSSANYTLLNGPGASTGLRNPGGD